MIQIIYGEKGTGKTKKIIDTANDAVAIAKGSTVFIDKNNSLMQNLTHKIRLVNASEYDINSCSDLASFVKGILAGNCDIETVFIDGIAKITRSELSQMQQLFDAFDKLTAEHKVSFIITISSSKENLPSFIAKYI